MDDKKNNSKDKKENKYQDVLDQYAAKVDSSTDENIDVKTTDLTNDTVKMTETPVETPVASPVETPVASPVETPVASPVETKPLEDIDSNKIKVPPEIPSLTTPENTPEPISNINETEKSATPEEIKDKINEVLSYETNAPEQEPINPISDSQNSPSNLIKMLFFIALSIFILIILTLAYFLLLKPSNSNTDQTQSTITPTSSEVACTLNDMELSIGEDFTAADGCNICTCEAKDVISCTEKACESTSSATKTATQSSKTSFQKMIINWNLYKEIPSSERKNDFTDYLDGTTSTNTWFGNINSSDKLYSFAQKIIKGSIKKLSISKNNLKTILGDYEYTFYTTPNYEKWSNDKFLKEVVVPEYAVGGIGEISPLYAYPDKLVWTTAGNCGGVRSNDIEEQKAQDQCTNLVKEIHYAFL